MGESTATIHSDPPAVIDHCFREDNCAAHAEHHGDECCCCGLPADVHEGCDCP